MPARCSKGRVDPSQTTRYQLFAESAGRCQNPQCLTPLFKETASGRSVHFAEAAHIVAASEGGARASASVSGTSAAAGPENLVLLCANCHTVVDKAESDYPVELLWQWKGEQARMIDSLFGVRQFDARRDARNWLEPLLAANRAVFDKYGPMTEYRFDPESQMPELWRRHVQETILPNNRLILNCLDRNRALLHAHELSVVEEFRIHLIDFESRHTGGSSISGGAQYPAEMNKILTGEQADV